MMTNSHSHSCLPFFQAGCSKDRKCSLKNKKKKKEKPLFTREKIKKKCCVTPLDEASMELLSRVYTVLYEMLHMEEASLV